MSTTPPRRVLVLAGGISHEREVSLHSGRRVADRLSAHGVEVVLRDPDVTLLNYLAEKKVDVVWPALHGIGGEDGSLRGVLELLRIPFVGSSADAARLAWDKPTAKVLVARAGIATPDSITLPREAFREFGAAAILATITQELSTPLVVKPAQGGSAQGVTLVTTDLDDLPRAMVEAYSYCEVALIERAIVGTEIAIGILDIDGPVALPAVEIEPLQGGYDFEARYNAGQTRFFTPARLSAQVAERAAAAAITAHRTLGLRHLSRVDLIVDNNGTPWFLEANVVPGFTETSLFPQALEAAGHDIGWVYAELAEAALRQVD